MAIQVLIVADYVVVRNRGGRMEYVWIDVPHVRDRDDWRTLSPASKVLAIHEVAREVTQGKPFTAIDARDV